MNEDELRAIRERATGAPYHLDPARSAMRATKDVLALLAEVERLRAGLTQISQARCLGNNEPPGCANTCITCQARRVLSGKTVLP